MEKLSKQFKKKTVESISAILKFQKLPFFPFQKLKNPSILKNSNTLISRKNMSSFLEISVKNGNTAILPEAFLEFDYSDYFQLF